MAAEILIVKLSSLGDLFHALPAVHALRSGLNASRVDWVTQPEYVELVNCFKDVDDIIPFPRKGFARQFPAFRRKLRTRKYDYVVDMQGLFKSGLVGAAADASRKVGPMAPREGARFFYDDYPQHGTSYAHAVDRLCEVVTHLDVAFDDKKFPVAFPEVSIEGAGPRIGLAPCSRWGAKNWPIDRFATLAEKLREKLSCSIYVVGGPGDRAIGDQITAANYNLCGAHTIPETGEALRQMDVVVSNDSGPMHIASAVGTPVVALFRPTDPLLTGPYGAMHRVLRADDAIAQGTGHGEYKSDDDRWMRGISVDEVLAEVCGLLEA